MLPNSPSVTPSPACMTLGVAPNVASDTSCQSSCKRPLEEMVPIIPTTAVEEGSEERQNFEDGVAKKTLQPG